MKLCSILGGNRKRIFGIGALVLFLCCMFLTACAGSREEASEPETVAAETDAEETEQAGAREETPEEAEGTLPDSRKETVPGAKEAGGSIDDWARAFCRRDGETIGAMCDDGTRDSLAERELLSETETGYSFGWSSPWPWDEEKDYEIIEETENSAEILYYAWVSDPHVTVWRESLTYRRENGRCIVEEEALERLDYICTGEEYARAYPHGINGTRMDYMAAEDGSIGETLNDNARKDKDRESYAMLFRPEAAAGYLLNFLENPGKVSVSVEEAKQEDGSVLVSVVFTEDGSSLRVRMIQPYGEDGIWIPQDYLVNREPGVEAVK